MKFRGGGQDGKVGRPVQLEGRAVQMTKTCEMLPNQALPPFFRFPSNCTVEAGSKQTWPAEKPRNAAGTISYGPHNSASR
jgi:hypothetical protein